jgi:hypothetical protein
MTENHGKIPRRDHAEERIGRIGRLEFDSGRARWSPLARQTGKQLRSALGPASQSPGKTEYLHLRDCLPSGIDR